MVTDSGDLGNAGTRKTVSLSPLKQHIILIFECVFLSYKSIHRIRLPTDSRQRIESIQSTVSGRTIDICRGLTGRSYDSTYHKQRHFVDRRQAHKEACTWHKAWEKLRPNTGCKDADTWRRYSPFHGLLCSYQTNPFPVPLTFLTSRRNGLLTVYDVSRSDCNSLVHLHASPYALPSVYAPDARHLGQVIFQHPSDTNDSDINILQLSESGSLHMMALELSLKGDGSDITHNARRTVPEWSAEVRKLEEEAKTVQTDVGPLGGRSYSVVDLQQAYKSKIPSFDSFSCSLDCRTLLPKGRYYG